MVDDCPDARSAHPFALAEYGVVRSNVVESRRRRLRLLMTVSSVVSLVKEAVDRLSGEIADGVWGGW